MLDVQGLHFRAAFFRLIRQFFHDHGFIEVDTPIRLPVIIPESNIVPIRTEDGHFLQTSPEQSMKRLLAQGADKIFQLCHCFRKNENGRYHHEEFIMLEWYRNGEDYRTLMQDCEGLLSYVVNGFAVFCSENGFTTPVQDTTISQMTRPGQYITVEDAFSAYAPCSVEKALELGIYEELLVEYVEPNLGHTAPLFIYDYPIELASLACQKKSNPELAERFELYLSGIEIANGFSELTDKEQQFLRFQNELQQISGQRGETWRMPDKFLGALEELTSAAGIALGIDRLFMLLCGKRNLNDVTCFTPDEL